MARKQMPSKKKIAAFWAERLVDLERADCQEEVDGNWCFACGWEGKIERAHILAVSEGGDNLVSNLHLLCDGCHRASEPLSGQDYWEWFASQNAITGLINWASKHSPIALSNAINPRIRIEVLED